jgi:hypothetical protein
MKRFGINFMDTIYWNVFTPLLEHFLVAHAKEPEGVENLTKDRLVAIVNKLSPGIYLLHGDLYHNKGPSELEKTFLDLQIREDQILVDEEVNAYFLESGRHWGVFYWVDFETKQVFNI